MIFTYNLKISVLVSDCGRFFEQLKASDESEKKRIKAKKKRRKNKNKQLLSSDNDQSPVAVAQGYGSFFPLVN